jgi:hypothetical protein
VTDYTNEQEITKLEIFQGIELRFIPSAIGWTIPASDIADALGRSRGNITRIMDNNPDLFKGLSIIQSLPTNGGPQDSVCINIYGIIGILSRLRKKKNPDKEKEAAERERAQKFQAWFRERVIKMQVQTKLIQPSQAPQAFMWSGEAAEHMRFASNLHQAWGITRKEAFEIGLRSAQKATGIDLSEYRNALTPAMPYHQAPAIQAPEPRQVPLEILPQASPAQALVRDQDKAPAKSTAGHITVTEIATLLNKEGTGAVLKGEDINRFLCTTGYQYRDPEKNYLLTEKGSLYGIVCTGYFSSGHVGEYIKWKPDIIEISEMRKYKPTRIRDS